MALDVGHQQEKQRDCLALAILIKKLNCDKAKNALMPGGSWQHVGGGDRSSWRCAGIVGKIQEELDKHLALVLVLILEYVESTLQFWWYADWSVRRWGKHLYEGGGLRHSAEEEHKVGESPV
ncbi:hypothetical protein BS47DRAFT_1366130 [Hydnum rufescens UP504]|uniref:Uncharacterized protein n=1 Tax=Hydnum rufescens UP504 TaxID=1448309 RepID=A0A9P6ALQ0_9AGAM|nr:hypothetical protein BS47DRAFT_1366130 [Hydnum rufescens UP504]